MPGLQLDLAVLPNLLFPLTVLMLLVLLELGAVLAQLHLVALTLLGEVTAGFPGLAMKLFGLLAEASLPQMVDGLLEVVHAALHLLGVLSQLNLRALDLFRVAAGLLSGGFALFRVFGVLAVAVAASVAVFSLLPQLILRALDLFRVVASLLSSGFTLLLLIAVLGLG